MSGLAVLLASLAATLACYMAVHRGRLEPGRRRVGEVSLTLLCALSLLLALRLGARSYPGVFVRNSPVLTRLLNGPTLFTTVGYGLVLLGAASQALGLAWSGPGSNALRASGAVLLVLAALISAYGLLWVWAWH